MTTIEMARASHLDVYGLGKDHEKFVASLERFATLIRADERNSWPAEMEAMERQVNILTDALAQASKNAARYQVLRTWDLGGSDHGLYSPEEVDKAVDDCIKDHT